MVALQLEGSTLVAKLLPIRNDLSTPTKRASSSSLYPRTKGMMLSLIFSNYW